MQFENFNKKIIEAAEQHHPAYDEQAWKKMEKLLDKHLPVEKKDRRGLIFFILFFLLLGGGLFIAIDRPWQKEKMTANRSTPVPTDHSLPGQTQGGQQQNTEGGTSTQPGNNQDVVDRVASNEKNQLAPSPVRIDLNNPSALNVHAKQNRAGKETLAPDEKLLADGKNIRLNNDVKNDRQKPGEDLLKKQEVITGNENGAVNNRDQNISTSPKKDETAKPGAAENKNENKSDPSTAQKNKKEKKNFLPNITFSLSAGPDVSKAGSSSLGKTTVVYGAGIGYTWKRFTLKTGVYAAEKIYSADEDEYDFNYALPPNVKFEGADANCKVIEIPVSLSYNFGAKKNHSWFVSTGLSSYLMKREDYKYWYANYGTGSYYSKNFEFKNRNKHYFSVLGISGGYTRKLNDFISVTAEPYLRIPTQGIGMGRVHLNSAGVLFSIGIQPFHDKKKK